MAIFANLVDLGIAFLLATVFAEYFKFRGKAKKGWNWIVLAGIWFIFAGAFNVMTAVHPSGNYLGTYLTPAVWYGIEQIFEILAWIFALVGTLFIAYEAFIEK